jgi:hypothetical protein
MHILVDGYNLIRQSPEFRSFEQLGLESGRKHLISRLEQFRKMRGHKITIVFDGWENGSLTQERTREGATTVIYSRKGERADEVIKRMAAQGGRNMVVVTSDRDLAYSVTRSGATVISSSRFEESIAQLDGFSMSYGKDDDDRNRFNMTPKKGPSKKLSKRKRVELSRLKNL